MFSIQNLGFEWPSGQAVFQNLSFKIDRQKWAVIAPNGGGKTTLLRVLARELPATEGHIVGQGKVIYLPQDPDHEIMQSGGEWMMQRLEKALLQNPALLLLDEPTNHLDEKHQALFRRRIFNIDCAVIMASHDVELLRACNAVWVFEGPRLRFFSEGFKAYEEQIDLEKQAKEVRLQTAKQTLKMVKAESQRAVSRQERRNRQGQKDADKGGMPKILIGARKRAAEATTGQVQAKSSMRVKDATDEFSDAVMNRVIDTKPYFEWPAGDRLKNREQFAARELQLCKDGKSLWTESVNLSVWTGQRLWIRGVNGAGKTTLMNRIAQQCPASDFQFTGDVLKECESFAWIQQLPKAFNDPHQNLFDVLRTGSWLTDQELLNQLARFQFPLKKAQQPFCLLSGGEKVRAGYARIFLGDKKPELLLLDEPSNHLDLQTKQWLSEILESYSGAIVVISHDKRFAQSLYPTAELRLNVNR